MPAASTVAPGLDARTRPARIAALAEERFDLLVIGGGITGAGVALEAASRGLRVALLEARDFASGTSSRSSKLIHGGLRYLAMGDVATVRQTALERKILRRIAPHLAEPRWMVVPAKSRAGLMKLRAAVTTYEKLGEVEEADLHRNWSGDDLAAGEPLLDRKLHRHACVYREYVTHDARLVLANLRAAAALGAIVLAQALVRSIAVEGGRAVGAEAECRETGERFRVRARCVVNAAGPWVDAVRALETNEASPRLHLSKGVHVVVDRERLPVRNVLILGTKDRRSIFAVPRGDAVYLGTTDTSYEAGAETWPPVAIDDVTYLLDAVAHHLGVKLGPEDVFSAWAGLRPLVAEAGKAPTEISRKDEVWLGPAGVVTIAGGKLTGYRPMARTAVERAAEAAGLPLADAPTEPGVLPGGEGAGDFDAATRSLVEKFALDRLQAEALAEAHGSEADAVAAAGPEPVAPGARLLRGQVRFAVEHEDAAHVEDVLYRRTGTAFYDRAGREASVAPVADQMAELLGWDAARTRAETDAARRRLAADLAFKEDSNPLPQASAQQA